jgi:hypothetical protein
MINSMSRTSTEIITAGQDKKKELSSQSFFMESSCYSQFCELLAVEVYLSSWQILLLTAR